MSFAIVIKIKNIKSIFTGLNNYKDFTLILSLDSPNNSLICDIIMIIPSICKSGDRSGLND